MGLMRGIDIKKSLLGVAFRVLAIAGLVTFNFVTPALAAAPDSLKDTLSDSRPSTTANHVFALDMASSTSIVATETVTITFPGSSFTSVSSVVAGDVTWTDSGSHTVVANGACASNNVELTSATSTVLTFTACTGYSGSTGGTVTITIANRIGNPSAATYTITVAGSYGDSSKNTVVAIVAGTTLSATVSETLTFSVGGVTNSSCTTTGGTTITSTSTTVPYSTVSSDTFYDICQQLTTATNASGGYSTTVQTTSLPTSGGNTIAKGGCNSGSSCTDTSEGAWSTAGDNGYGYCMDDTQDTAAATADAGWGTNGCGAGTQNFKTIANAGAAETARIIMSKAGVTTQDNIALIGYRLTVDASQAAGTYQTTIVYICTPTF